MGVIKNKEKIINELGMLFLQFGRERRHFCTKVYADYDVDNGLVKLSVYEHAEYGICRLDIESKLLYTDEGEWTRVLDCPFYEDVDQIIAALEVDKDKLLSDVAQVMVDKFGALYAILDGVDDENMLDYSKEKLTREDIVEYISRNDNYMTKLEDYYSKHVVEKNMDVYMMVARKCIDMYEEELDVMMKGKNLNEK